MALGKKTVQKKATSGSKTTKDMTSVPVKPAARKSAMVQKNAPGASKGLKGK